MRLPAFADYESFRIWRNDAAKSLPAAVDIARSHGGEIILSPSPLGGLRATLRIPRPA